ncbi:MAG: BMP family ABC transporter substrate-binding protein [Defluviitaleaceae bacterium]|nr:BMP family ABC transporter substrate-binding protein [Defluviitaleaceae bacterium]
MKRIFAGIALLAMMLFVASCGGNGDGNGAATPGGTNGGGANGGGANGGGEPAATFSAGMVTDQSGVNDQSFNQSSWDGLLRLRDDIGATIGYLESANPGEKAPNMDRFIDQGKDIIWVIGFLGADPVAEQALINPDQSYGIIDFNFGPDILPNVTAVDFMDNEATFLAGYLAARHSNTGVIGFIGGMEIPVIHRFEAGFRAGAEFANHTHDLDVEVLVQYIGDFENVSIARGISTAMHAGGADVLYAAAGGAGQGAIDVAIEEDIYIIGVDLDQSHLAPNNMIISTLKHVGEAIYDVSLRLSRGENVGGQNLVYGIAQGAVGITPFEGSTAALVDSSIHASTLALSARIASGELNIPTNAAELEEFLNNM